MPYAFAAILLLYTFNILLLKQKKLPALDITHFFLHTSTFTWVRMLKNNSAMSNTGHLFCLNSAISFAYSYSQPDKNINNVPADYCTTIVWYWTSHSKWVYVLFHCVAESYWLTTTSKSFGSQVKWFVQ